MSYSRSQNLNPGESEEPLCMFASSIRSALTEAVEAGLGLAGDPEHTTFLSLRETVGISNSPAGRPFWPIAGGFSQSPHSPSLGDMGKLRPEGYQSHS